jgi:UDP:flavonoid glycosyltransferase YjiC (YdhE family)
VKALIDPALVSLFGSETRAVTLGALANSSRPLTAYRIARITGAQLSKVGAELRRLEAAQLVSRNLPDRTAPTWSLSDRSLVSFFQRRARIVASEDWDVQVRATTEQARLRRRLKIDTSHYRPSPRPVPNRREFERPAEKDRILAAAGPPTSRKSRTRRRPPRRRSLRSSLPLRRSTTASSTSLRS